MANTFITPSDVVRDANLILKDDLIAANLVNRSVEQRFAKKVGDTVTVKVPPTIAASEFSSTTSAADVTETSTDVVLDKHFYVRADLTSDELLLELDDFNTVVTMPAMRGLVRAIDNECIAKIAGGFSRNISGTAGTSPSTHAHMLAAEKTIFDNRGNTDLLVALISSTVHASFAQLNIFTSSDFGQDKPNGLRSNSLGKVSNINFFRSPNVGTIDFGDVAGTPALSAAGTAGDATVAIDGLTAATGTIKEGARFTIAGTATVYTVTADATIASNAATLAITPVLSANEDEDDVLTFETEQTEDVVYNPGAVAGAIIPGPAMSNNAATSFIDGIGLRIISDTSTSTLATTWVFKWCVTSGAQ